MMFYFVCSCFLTYSSGSEIFHNGTGRRWEWRRWHLSLSGRARSSHNQFAVPGLQHFLFSSNNILSTYVSEKSIFWLREHIDLIDVWMIHYTIRIFFVDDWVNDTAEKAPFKMFPLRGCVFSSTCSVARIQQRELVMSAHEVSSSIVENPWQMDWFIEAVVSANEC